MDADAPLAAREWTGNACESVDVVRARVPRRGVARRGALWRRARAKLFRFSARWINPPIITQRLPMRGVMIGQESPHSEPHASPSRSSSTPHPSLCDALRRDMVRVLARECHRCARTRVFRARRARRGRARARGGSNARAGAGARLDRARGARSRVARTVASRARGVASRARANGVGVWFGCIRTRVARARWSHALVRGVEGAHGTDPKTQAWRPNARKLTKCLRFPHTAVQQDFQD